MFFLCSGNEDRSEVEEAEEGIIILGILIIAFDSDTAGNNNFNLIPSLTFTAYVFISADAISHCKREVIRFKFATLHLRLSLSLSLHLRLQS